MTQREVPLIYSEQAAAGCACRAQFLSWVETMMQNNDPLAGLSVKDLLLESGRWCGPADHLAAMMSEVGRKQQWGGYVANWPDPAGGSTGISVPVLDRYAL